MNIFQSKNLQAVINKYAIIQLSDVLGQLGCGKMNLTTAIDHIEYVANIVMDMIPKSLHKKHPDLGNPSNHFYDTVRDITDSLTLGVYESSDDAYSAMIDNRENPNSDNIPLPPKNKHTWDNDFVTFDKDDRIIPVTKDMVLSTTLEEIQEIIKATKDETSADETV